MTPGPRTGHRRAGRRRFRGDRDGGDVARLHCVGRHAHAEVLQQVHDRLHGRCLIGVAAVAAVTCPIEADDKTVADEPTRDITRADREVADPRRLRPGRHRRERAHEDAPASRSAAMSRGQPGEILMAI